MTIQNKAAAGRIASYSSNGSEASNTMDAAVDVLIAENNETNKFYVENVLSELGFSFRTVDNGLAVVEAYRRSRPRIILMDIAMPLSDGVEATQKIRRYEQRNDMLQVPIIALSANAIPGLSERYLDAGMNDCLLKPYSIDQINGKLTKWILPPATSAEERPSQP